MRRLVCSLILAGVALSLQASVPSVSSPATLHQSANPQFTGSTKYHAALEMTSAPADISFYDEFFPAIAAPQAQPKTGMFHWVGNLIKKGRQKIALLSPQKLF